MKFIFCALLKVIDVQRKFIIVNKKGQRLKQKSDIFKVMTSKLK